ncbi:MAG: hypothetical protein ACFCVE_13825 [Phycisphaerae bacterium]
MHHAAPAESSAEPPEVPPAGPPAGPKGEAAQNLDAEEFVCLHCGYDLRGITSDRCPECGLAFDRAAGAQPRIPWEHRIRLGRVRAFAATALAVLRRPGRLGVEVTRPVDYRGARYFHLICVAVATLAVTLPAAGAFVIQMHETWEDSGRYAAAAAWDVATLAVPAVFGLFVGLLLATGLPSYFFHGTGRAVEAENRAVAVSYYASGALLPTALLPPLAGLFAWLVADDPGRAPVSVLEPFFLVGVLTLTMAIYSLLKLVATPWFMVRRATSPGLLRGLAYWLVVPAGQVVLIIMSVVVCVATVFYLSVVFVSVFA